MKGFAIVIWQTDSQKKKKNPWLLALADFHGVNNSLTVIDFKLPRV